MIKDSQQSHTSQPPTVVLGSQQPVKEEVVPTPPQEMEVRGVISTLKQGTKLRLQIKKDEQLFGIVRVMRDSGREDRIFEAKLAGSWSEEKKDYKIALLFPILRMPIPERAMDLQVFQPREDFPKTGTWLGDSRYGKMLRPREEKKVEETIVSKKVLMYAPEDSEVDEEVDDFDEYVEGMTNPLKSMETTLDPKFLEAFRPSHSQIPAVAMMRGADLVTWSLELKEAMRQGADFMGLAKDTMEEHRRTLSLMASHVNPELPLVQALVLAIEKLREEREWRWSTTLKRAATVQGVLAILPLYRLGTTAVLLKNDPIWGLHMKHYARKTKEEVPNQPKAAAIEQIYKAIKMHMKKRPDIAVAIMLGWLTASRLGCVLQLGWEDLIWNENRLAITFHRGKGVLTRGPYTVDTHPLPPEWMKLLKEFAEKRQESGAKRLFSQNLLGSELCAALRKSDPALEQRSVRRGALQTMASRGVSEEMLMRFSGHTQVSTLRRYLNWNRVNSAVTKGMQEAATALVL